VIFYLFKSGW